MLERLREQKNLVIGIAIGVVILGAGGYYAYSKKKTAGVDHSAHQAAIGNMSVSGDKVTMDATARQLAGVQVAPVQNRALNKEIRTTGKIAVNDGNKALLTSRVEGRVDAVYISAEGEYVAPGQAIASVYSPTYVAAQEEYLLALDNVQKLKDAGPDMAKVNQRLLEAARRKLQVLGIPDGDVAHLGHTRQAQTQVTIRAQFGGTVTEKFLQPGAFVMPGEKLFALTNLSTVWVNVDIYERDLGAVKIGQEVVITSPAYPGQTFSGSIAFISPMLDDATRAVKVRVEMANPANLLKPNMLVSAVVRTPLAEGLIIPSSSYLDTGTRKVVYVVQDENTFVKRDVVIGQEAEGYVQVLSGLKAGETVVTAAAFLIDSQTQLGGFGSHAGHGGPKTDAASVAPVTGTTPPATGGKQDSHAGH